ncbi:MacS family sensor histidine kinase [Nonomuraea sp. NPDC051191]|uniref:MacS family sensor histidine kinase n=1 Tax=Nonomuraea sp. NPDC051191 TaxID=3364372 RepID=UPI00379DC31B
MSIEGPFWRAIAVFRVASLLYAVVLMAQYRGYEEPVIGWLVIALMTLWTAGATYAYSVEGLRGWPLPAIDLLVALACLLASPYVEGARQGAAGTMPVPATWIAAPVLAWAVYGGRRAGAVAAAVVAAADLWLRVRAPDAPVMINGAVLLFLSGVVVGHVARLAKEAEERMQRAAEMEAAQRERDRLARDLHDSVLQVLALVQRRGRQIGGEAAELGRLAGEQEAALRELIAARPAPTGSTDLRSLLIRHGSPLVTVSTPATPLVLPTPAAEGVAAAVGAALDNVRRHCGLDARAWVFAESCDDVVMVTVRDEGPGIPEGRLERAAAEGRLGVAQSIRGRVADLGGTVAVTSARSGTEIEISLPAERTRKGAGGPG